MQLCRRVQSWVEIRSLVVARFCFLLVVVLYQYSIVEIEPENKHSKRREETEEKKMNSYQAFGFWVLAVTTI
jgi:hypothetical protein